MLRSILFVLTLLAIVACRKQLQTSTSPEGIVASAKEPIVDEDGDTVVFETYTPDILAKGEPKDENGDPIYIVAEEMPDYPLGYKALIKYLTVVNSEQQGRVAVSFLVGKDGTIRNPKVIRSLDEKLDQKALRLVCEMPKWNPGKSKGEPVVVQYLVLVYYVKTQKEADLLWDKKFGSLKE
ncbi:MAG: energy transducer TonB [Parabacteroides sp.]|nr:energy transducer TonB [Parabacteroides sp.]